MSSRFTAATFIRLAMLIALLAAAGLAGATRSAQSAPESFQSTDHGDGPQVHFLYGSGSATGGRQITLRVELTEPAPAEPAAGPTWTGRSRFPVPAISRAR